MPSKDPISSPPPGGDISWHKWFYDLYTLLTGRQGRQNFLNVITGAVPNGSGVLTNLPNGDAVFAPISSSVTNGAFKVYQNAGHAINTGIKTLLTWDAAVFDEDSAVNLAAGKFTAVKDGKYMITACNGFPPAAAGGNQILELNKNGVAYSLNITVNLSGIADYSFCTVTDVVDLLIGDYVEVYVTHNFGIPVPTIGQIDTNYFSAIRAT